MADDLRYRIGIDGSAASKTLSGLEGGVSSLGASLLGLGAGAVFTKVLKDGFEFNQLLGDSESAIAKVLAQFKGLDEAAAKAAAAGAMQRLIALEPKAAGTLGTLIDGFMSTLADSQAVGMSVEQNIDLVGRFANAMANANIPTEQLGQEMRSILSANIGADSSLAKKLVITNEQIQQAQEAGRVYEFLVKKIGKIGEAGDTAAVRFSSLQSAIQQTEAVIAKGLFDTLLDESVGLTSKLNENRQAFADLGSGIGVVVIELGKFAGFLYEANTQVSALTAKLGLMVFDGESYSDASAKIDAVTESRKQEAEAATKQAEADKKAAAALNSATSGGSGGGAGSGLKKKKKEEPEDAAKIFDEVLSKQEQLNELKRSAAEDEMTAAQKIASVRERLAAAAENEAAVKADPFGGSDPRAALDAEAKRVALARELAQLVREETQAQDQLSKKIADKAESARKEVAAHNQSRNNLMGELAILEAQASGNDKKEKAARRKLQIENDTLAIMREQQTSEENAARLATRKADLQDKISKRQQRETSGESQPSKIGGVTRSARGFGGLAEFDALQKNPTLGIAGPGRESSLDAFKLRQRPNGEDTTKLLGSGRGQALSQRLATATALPKAEGQNKEDSSANLLGQVVAELKRIRTA